MTARAPHVAGARSLAPSLEPPPGLRAFAYGDRVLFVYPLDAPAMPAGLTGAEQAVAAQIVDGTSNQAIAEQRGTSVRTVANQVAQIFRKLGVQSRAELVALLHGACLR